MAVVTFNPTLLAEACHQLSCRVKAGGYTPSLLIGIQHGGAEVARRMRNDFPEAAYCEVRLSRPDTRQKSQGLAHRLLQHLPLWMCNTLRIVESRVNEWRSKGKDPVRIGTIRLPQDITSTLSTPSSPLLTPLNPSSPLLTPPSLLLIDDAIDTGATIQQARLQLLKQFPDITIRVAVITVFMSIHDNSC